MTPREIADHYIGLIPSVDGDWEELRQELAERISDLIETRKRAVVVEEVNWLHGKEDEDVDKWEVSGVIFADTDEEIKHELKRYFAQVREVNEEDIEVGSFSIAEGFPDEVTVTLQKNPILKNSTRIDVRISIANQVKP